MRNNKMNNLKNNIFIELILFIFNILFFDN